MTPHPLPYMKSVDDLDYLPAHTNVSSVWMCLPANFLTSPFFQSTQCLTGSSSILGGTAPLPEPGAVESLGSSGYKGWCQTGPGPVTPCVSSWTICGGSVISSVVETKPFYNSLGKISSSPLALTVVSPPQK